MYLFQNQYWYLSIIQLQWIICNKYCHICQSHELCVSKDAQYDNCIDYRKVPLSVESKAELLEAYNSLRNYVASGGFFNNTKLKFLEASRMFMLKWNDELSLIAQRWADQCPEDNYDECLDTNNYSVGRNIFSMEISNYKVPQLTEVLTKIWLEGLEHLKFEKINSFDNSTNWRSKIFTQSVWGSTRYLGCGSSMFKRLQQNDNYIRIFVLVCNLAPGGNIPNFPVYKTGRACSDCPTKTCNAKYGFLCNENELQVSKKYTDQIFEYLMEPWNWESKLVDREIHLDKITGVWFDGKCRCNYVYRSCENSDFLRNSYLFRSFLMVYLSGWL